MTGLPDWVEDILIGEFVEDVTFSEYDPDVLVLGFANGYIRFINNSSVKKTTAGNEVPASAQDLKGRLLERIVFCENNYIKAFFDGGFSVRMGLRDEDYIGPEALLIGDLKFRLVVIN